MKNVFKKGLVVLLASLFVTSVFAAEATTTAAAKPATTKQAVKHCKKACKNVKNKKACKKHCKNMKKAEATTSKTAQ